MRDSQCGESTGVARNARKLEKASATRRLPGMTLGYTYLRR